ncbi:predicted protein [Nematostella vectensis]|uniref:Protein disulfide-isomerase n=1 Tax=Nematostella vectensis TaxID=45351 RepID=A7SXD7_NEMVE|nr:predicted protein [Nematostella vectensis]|eukprot:XP_001623734.1 predicted protein [Nematostella vectensis]
MLYSTAFVLLFVGSTLSSDVLDLGDSNFKSGVAGKDIMLVEFFAPWCGHCKRLAPEYETAAEALKKNDPPVPLAKVDCTEAGKDTCSKYGVSGYPTLKIFRNGEMSKDYDGPRDSSGIIRYMKKQAGPSSVEIKSVDHLEKKLDDAESNVVVGFLDGDDDLKNAFMRTANEMRDSFSFAHASVTDVLEKYNYKNQIVVFRPKHLHTKLEPSFIAYTGSPDDFYIKKFINAKAHGRVGQRTPDNEEQFPKPLCVVFFDVDWKKNAKGSKYWRNRVLKVTKFFDDKAMNFAIASFSDYERVLSDIGVTDKANPSAVVYNDAGDKFLMKEKFSVDSFKQFLEDYFAGSLKPHIKSEPLPESNDGPVKVVVGENFKEIVNDPTKDVLIEFYAPWCGHCKSLEPKYNELGEKLQDVKDIVIAKMDATANDAPPNFSVQGFPTIYWAPANNKENPEKYEGGREVSDFVDFIKRKATKPVNLDEKKKKKSKSEL